MRGTHVIIIVLLNEKEGRGIESTLYSTIYYLFCFCAVIGLTSERVETLTINVNAVLVIIYSIILGNPHDALVFFLRLKTKLSTPYDSRDVGTTYSSINGLLLPYLPLRTVSFLIHVSVPSLSHEEKITRGPVPSP